MTPNQMVCCQEGCRESREVPVGARWASPNQALQPTGAFSMACAPPARHGPGG